MRWHGRSWLRRGLTGCTLALWSLSLAALAAEPLSSPSEMAEDAELTDVFFVDADRGWAVGDRGVIWHTDDGGRRWQLQPTAATCRPDRPSAILSLAEMSAPRISTSALRLT